MKKLAFVFGLALIGITACKTTKGTVQRNDKTGENTSENSTSKDSVECTSIVLDTAGFNRTSDPYQLIGAEIKGNILEIEVEYGGGCGGDEWNLYWNGMMAKSLPPKVSIVLQLTDKDFCKALIRKKVCFDISSVYNGEVIFQLKNFRGDLRYKP